MRKITVYKGLKNGNIVHIGITTQIPSVRFRTHEKRKLIDTFEVISEFNSVEEALQLEKELILKYKPIYSKRIKQNDNRKLSKNSLESRKGHPEWCQSCLRRRVSKGYKKCLWCTKK